MMNINKILKFDMFLTFSNGIQALRYKFSIAKAMYDVLDFQFVFSNLVLTSFFCFRKV